MITWTVKFKVMTTHCCETDHARFSAGLVEPSVFEVSWTYDRSLSLELVETEDGGSGMVEDVQES